jgi:putative transposase
LSAAKADSLIHQSCNIDVQRQKGEPIFFTVVTHDRQKILTADKNIEILRAAFQHVMQNHPFRIDAHVILPDHLHFIWTLPNGDSDFSTRWRLIKSYFTWHVQKVGPRSSPVAE